MASLVISHLLSMMPVLVTKVIEKMLQGLLWEEDEGEGLFMFCWDAVSKPWGIDWLSYWT